jgi:hypothetical protein
MIAVLADETEHPIVREFFELFKTPWEFHHDSSKCDVLICSGAKPVKSEAQLVLSYGAKETLLDREEKIRICAEHRQAVISYKGERIPLYGRCLTFRCGTAHELVEESTQASLEQEIVSESQTVIRIGYELFQEIRHLLRDGQPPGNARIPTLDLHIALLRDLIVSHSIPLVEIPPVPAGYSFVSCLTHDVDHVGVRNHKFDHTMLGFVYRAIIGSVIDLFRSRKSLRDVVLNWMAAFSLPLIQVGLVKDFWNQFDRYLDIEKGLPSTFFVIPYKGTSGRLDGGPAPSKRATRYDISDVTGQLGRIRLAHCEVGLHGIDAWRDSEKGRTELERIRQVTGEQEIGVRMHWLFFNEGSPVQLEKAGFSYDSTAGYNETVGYRAGTTQAFKPLMVERILELPLHIMDTALFYPSYMNLSPDEARTVVDGLVKNATRFGGALTVNWHDRSIAPERLWTDFYVRLVEDLKRKRAWFATASQAVSWFKKRRSTVIESVIREGDSFRIRVSLDHNGQDVPGLRVRVYNARSTQTKGFEQAKLDPEYAEVAFNRSDEIQIST